MITQAPTQRILRSQIDFAYYNPRRISEGNKKRLKKSLKEFGLVQDPIWNKRSGRLVGGHQRIELMDSEAHKKDYEIDVKVVDLDDDAEFRLNVILNNAGAQGEFDYQAVSDAAKDFGVDLGDLGFSSEDLVVNFNLDSGLDPDAAKDIGDAKQHKLDARAKHQQQGRNGEVGATDAEFVEDSILRIPFESVSQKMRHLGKFGFAGNSKAIPADLYHSVLRQKFEQGLF